MDVFGKIFAVIIVGAMLCSYLFGSGRIARMLVGFLGILILILLYLESN